MNALTILPVLTGLRDFHRGHTSGFPTLLDMRPAIMLRRGAEAIRLALNLEEIGKGDEVLVPAFNCPSMVSPVLATGAAPVFYGVTEDLRIDISSIKRQLSPATRAILAPHFFGRIQSFLELRDVCSSRRVLLIEDCAHALTGVNTNNEVGRSGDYVVASPRKFAPIGEGGLLTGPMLREQPVVVRSAPVRSGARVLFDMLDHAVAAERLPAFRPWISAVKSLKARATSEGAAVSYASPSYRENEHDPPFRATGVSTCLYRYWDFEGAADHRRVHYRRIEHAASMASHVSIIGSDLPLSRAPYMVPVLLDDPRKQFAALKAAGVPVWRWENSQMGVCKVTDWYAQALVQIPCHQSLDDRCLERIERVLVELGSGQAYT